MQLNNDDWVNPLNTKLAIISQWIYKVKELAIANSIEVMWFQCSNQLIPFTPIVTYFVKLTITNLQHVRILFMTTRDNQTFLVWDYSTRNSTMDSR